MTRFLAFEYTIYTRLRDEILHLVRDITGNLPKGLLWILSSHFHHPLLLPFRYRIPKREMIIRLNSNNIPATIDYIKDRILQFSPGFIFDYGFLDDHFNQIYTNEQNMQILIEYFTILAIFILCLGLIGLASFMAEQRTKEIAIRKVLGAKTLGIMINLSKEFVMLVLAANIIAWPVAYYFMNEWIKSFSYRTDIGILVFVLSAISAIGIALITVSFQAYKAANANPVDSLMHE